MVIVSAAAAPMLLSIVALIFTHASQSALVGAFSPCSPGHLTSPSTLQLAREYIVIGGNLPGLGPEDENTYNMSKKERRQKEREKGEADFKSGKYKQNKKKFTINYDKLEQNVTRERTLMPREVRDMSNKLGLKSNLGVPSKPIKKKVADKRLSEKAARIQRQRTAGGTINSTGQTLLPQSPEKQSVQIRVGKRGDKIVTMVQGMTLPMSDRKELLREMKAKLGGGGTLVDGVLELQGSHADKVLEMMKTKGYTMAKVVKNERKDTNIAM